MNCSNHTFHESLVLYIQSQIRTNIGGVGTACLIGIGIVLNSFNLTVFLRSNNNRLSLYVFLASASISDSLYLIAALFNQSIPIILNELAWQRYTPVVLRFVFYPVMRISKTVNLWLVTAASVERFLVVWYPLRIWLHERRRAVIVTLVIVITGVMVNSPVFGEYYIKQSDSVAAAYNIRHSGNHYVLYYLIARSLLQLGFLLLISCLNVAILAAIRKAQQDEKAMGSKRIIEQRNSLMMVAYAGFFALCNTMPTVQYIIQQVVGKDINCTTPDQQLAWVVTRDVANGLNIVCAASTFVVYFASGSKFRKDCRSLVFFYCGRTRSKSSRTTPNVSTPATTPALSSSRSLQLKRLRGSLSSVHEHHMLLKVSQSADVAPATEQDSLV